MTNDSLRKQLVEVDDTVFLHSVEQLGDRRFPAETFQWNEGLVRPKGTVTELWRDDLDRIAAMRHTLPTGEHRNLIFR